MMIPINFKFPGDISRRGDLPGHPVVPIENKKQRKCKYCQIYKQRTKSGWRVVTNFKCGTCNVGLCSGENTGRNCFHLYHDEFVFGATERQSDTFQ